MKEKNTIKITESKLHYMIEEIVKDVIKNKILHESNDLYDMDFADSMEDSDSDQYNKDTYRGVPGTRLMQNGENSEISYKSHTIKEYDIDDFMWDEYQEDCESKDIEPDDDDFEEWVEQQGIPYIKGVLDDFINQQYN